MRIFILCFCLLYSSLSLADKSIQILSDAEIENNLKSLMSPLVKAANLNPENINIRIIADPSLNAFVTNGTNMFINSGLIIQFADDPNVIYGVMAHEIAHIYAGHIIQLRGEYEDMKKLAIGGTILGVASALAGAPEAGIFVGAASMQAAERGLLSYSRTHEVEADKVAIDLLYKTHNNGQGLIKFFQYMTKRERGLTPDPYTITHPLNNERIASIQNAVKNKLGKFGDNITPEIRANLKSMAIKLEAFLTPPQVILNKYKDNKYASAIGYFRLGKFKMAIELLDQFMAKEGNKPYLLELKGQFNFENGKFEEAQKYYQQSLQALPNDKIIKMELAIAKINQAKTANDRVLLDSAVSLLNQVIAKQPDNIMAYFMLSRAHGKLGNQGKAIEALAEFYFYQGSYDRSKKLADKVLKMTSPSSKEYLRASDIIEYTNNRKN